MNPSQPGTYSRRALVCVIGLAPQVLTETLYALAVQSDTPWVPTEIHVITTTTGAKTLVNALLSGRDGQFHRLCKAYLPDAAIDFTSGSQHIHIISRDGVDLDDIDDPLDSSAAGNTILRVVADLARDPSCAIHASIAGGRKTMGFFLGYALSLLGRAQDRLSHVLVSRPFEGHPDFFFPPRKPKMLTMRGGEPLSTAQAKVTLAPIRIVMFAAGLREKIALGRMDFDELVVQAEGDLIPLPIVISPAARSIQVGKVCVELEPVELAWYLHLAQRRREQLHEPGLVAPGMVRIDKAPERNIGVSDDALKAAYQRVGLSFKQVAVDPDTFKSRASYINKTLRRGFGPATAQRLTILGPGDRGKRDGQYGLLNLEPSAIHIA